MSGRGSRSNPPHPEHKLWLGNLDPSLTEYTLLACLKKFGTIAKLDFLYNVNPTTGARTPKGFAFVSYTTAASAQSALRALDGKMRLVGRTLWVKNASSNSKSAGGSLDANPLKRSLAMGSDPSSSSSSSSISSYAAKAPKLDPKKRKRNIDALQARLAALESTEDGFKLAVPGASSKKKA